MQTGYMMDGMEGHPCPIPKRIGIVHKMTSAEAAETATYVAQFLRGKGVEVFQEEADVSRRADLVVVLGGDGTLIHAAGLLDGRPVPILGINMGSLGFMTEVPQSGMYQALESILAGRATLSERMKLRVHLHRGGSPDRALDAEVLNDVVISKSALSRMVELDTVLGRLRHDATRPTASSSRRPPARPPIRSPRTVRSCCPTMRGVIVSPICPHTLTQRPLVVLGRREHRDHPHERQRDVPHARRADRACRSSAATACR